MRAIQQTRLTVIIPAHNEKARIAEVVSGAQKFAAEVIVVDDDSTDGTKEVTEELGAKVITNNFRKGYIGAIKAGFQRAQRDVIITLDADGEHDPEDIPRLVQPILDGKVDLVLGKRKHIARPSERLINRLTGFKVKVADSGTGFRAIRRDLALKLNLKGRCTCGVFVLEANSYGARIAEVPIALHSIPKERKTAWSHFWQMFYVLRWLTKSRVFSPESRVKSLKGHRNPKLGTQNSRLSTPDLEPLTTKMGSTKQKVCFERQGKGNRSLHEQATYLANWKKLKRGAEF